jgi:hypothetical protein
MAQTLLPQLFAVFKDDPLWHPNFTERKYCLLWRRSGLWNPLNVEPYTLLKEGSYITLETNGNESTPVECVIGSTRSRWWHTGFSVAFHGSEQGRFAAPVIDFQHRSFLPLEFNLQAMNDDDTWCMIRQMDQRRQRTRVEDGDLERLVQGLPSLALNGIPKAVAPAPVHASPIPKYILEGFLRDAEAQGQTCPITCKGPKECETVVVTNCYHWFDAESLATWRATKNECPVCKGDIKSTTEVTL